MAPSTSQLSRWVSCVKPLYASSYWACEQYVVNTELVPELRNVNLFGEVYVEIPRFSAAGTFIPPYDST